MATGREIQPGDKLTVYGYCSQRKVEKVEPFNDVFDGHEAVEVTFADNHFIDSRIMSFGADQEVKISR